LCYYELLYSNILKMQYLTELEKLISGKAESLHIVGETHESLLEQINQVLMSLFPGSWTEGQFVKDYEEDYIVYDIKVCNINNKMSSIRLVEFPNSFRILRVE